MGTTVLERHDAARTIISALCALRCGVRHLLLVELLRVQGGRLFLGCGLWLASLICAVCGCGSGNAPVATPSTGGSHQNPADSALDFREVAIPTLEDWRYQSGREANLNSILEIVGGGVACVDYDLDGHCDLFFPGGGHIDAEQHSVGGAPSLLLRGGPDWSLDDVTVPADAVVADLYTHGVAAADYDNDGFMDLLIGGYRGVRLLRNQGDGTFQDVTLEAGLTDAPWTTAAAWIDLNQDGMLDFYLGSYVDWDFDTHRVCPTNDGRADVCSPNAFGTSEDAVYVSAGDGSFKRAPDGIFTSLGGKALGVLTADFDSDGASDIYVTNDLLPNFLFRRQGHRFEERGMAAGVAIDAVGRANGSMGVALLDFNLDRRFDLVVTNFEHEEIAIYRNEGDAMFRHASRNLRLNLLDQVVGFGVAAADFDCDGDEDVLLTSGHVQYFPDSGKMEQPSLLLENLNGQHFERRVPSRCRYLQQRAVGRGLAIGDLDNDGDLDAVVTHLDEPPVLLENARRNDNPWLRLCLIGRDSSRTPIGTIATVDVGGRSMVRQLYGGGSYLSQSQLELAFGWEGTATPNVSIAWPSGKVTELQGVSPRQRLVVVEP